MFIIKRSHSHLWSWAYEVHNIIISRTKHVKSDPACQITQAFVYMFFVSLSGVRLSVRVSLYGQEARRFACYWNEERGYSDIVIVVANPQTSKSKEVWYKEIYILF